LEDISVDGKVILYFILDVCGVLNLAASLHGSKVRFFKRDFYLRLRRVRVFIHCKNTPREIC
jgi:hypothetical protein